MDRSSEWYEQVHEVEAMIRSASGYVQVSKDLRPRVLEAARMNSGERRARRRIRRVGLIAAVVAWFLTSSISRVEMNDSLRQLAFAVTAPAEVSSKSSADDAAWTLVNAYTEQRGRQAAALRVNF